jgi:hypothetical protein
MTSNATIKIRGSGYSVTAYLIDNTILKRLKKATVKDALYEENPISLVGNIAHKAIRVAEGFCIDKADDLKFSVSINGSVAEIEKIGFLDEGYIFEEEFSTSRNKTLIARRETNEELGEGIILKKNEMVIVEVCDIKIAEMSVSFNSLKSLQIKDIELGLVDLDVDTDISLAIYRNGLLCGMEKDIRYIICDDIKHKFEVEVLSSYSSSFYLAKRDSSGNWVSEFMS